MSKYKFHIDKPLPDSEQINRHKDFGRLYGQYETATRFGFWRRMLKGPKLFASVVLIGVLVWLVFEASGGDAQEDTPLIQPQMEVSVLFKHLNMEDGFCQYRQLRTMEDYFAAGIPLSFEEAGSHYLMEAHEIQEYKICSLFPIVSDTSYDSLGRWFRLNKTTGHWENHDRAEGPIDSSILLYGKKEKWPAANERDIRLLDDQAENLSRQLGKQNRKAFLVLPNHKTLLPLTYDGEGKHILPFVPVDALIWTVDADGQWWEVDGTTFDAWKKTTELNVSAKVKRK